MILYCMVEKNKNKKNAAFLIYTAKEIQSLFTTVP